MYQDISTDEKTRIKASFGDVSNKYALVIDDEEVLCDILCEILHLMGLSTLKASSGNEGLAVFKEHKDEIALILLDLLMPGMHGIETYRRLLSMNPDLKIIIMSGFPDQSDLEIENFPSNCVFLKKPFSLDDIKTKVAELINLEID